MPFWKEAQTLKENGADADEIRNFALLAIADQLKASNEISALHILVERGEISARRPTDADLLRTRDHLYRVLNWKVDDTDEEKA